MGGQELGGCEVVGGMASPSCAPFATLHQPDGRADDVGINLPGEAKMPAANEPCPYDRADRASRCQGCVAANDSITPCVVAWLGERTSAPGRPFGAVRMFSQSKVRAVHKKAA